MFSGLSFLMKMRKENYVDELVRKERLVEAFKRIALHVLWRRKVDEVTSSELYIRLRAKRVGALESHGFLDANDQLFRMADIGTEMVRMAMEAFAKRDVDMARAVCIRDDEVDQIHKDLFVDFIAHVAKHPTDATEIAHLLSISKNLERIGDHATTCAEMVYFSQTGRNLGDEIGG